MRIAMDWIAFAGRLLFDSSVRIVAVGAVVGLLLAVLRVRSGSARHLAWVAVLVAMMSMPVLRFAFATADVHVDVPEIVPGASRAWLPEIVQEPALPAALAAPAPVPSIEVTSTVAAAAIPTPARRIPSIVMWQSLAVGIYLTGLLAFAMRVIGGIRGIRKLDRSSRRLEFAHAPVFESHLVKAPVTIGISSPKILLPSSWIHWSDATLRAVLAHEGAHIRRRDSLVLFAAHVNRCVFWFHPFAWWLERQLRTTAEEACDDEAVNATGQPRVYAETLVRIAEAMRLAGGRVSWHALGAGGSGALGRRIDRLLRGDARRSASRSRIAALIVGCAMVIGIAAACRQQVAPVPALAPDPQLTAERAKRTQEQRARTIEWESAQSMSVAEAEALEAAVNANPSDVAGLDTLLLFYTSRKNHPLAWNELVSRRRPIAIGAITRFPDQEVAGRASGLLHPDRDPIGFAEGSKVWASNIERNDASAAVFRNAAMFFAMHNIPRAISILERASGKEPGSKPGSNPMTSAQMQLGFLYAAAISGRLFPSNRQVAVPTDPAFVKTVRDRLTTSTDARVVQSAGFALFGQGRIGTDDEVRAFGVACLERAFQLDPSLVSVKAQAVTARRAARELALRQRLIAAQTSLVGEEKLKSLPRNDAERDKLLRSVEAQALASLPEADRFVLLASLADLAFMGAEYAEFAKLPSVDPSERRTAARTYAEQALALAPKFKDDPAYAISIYTANMTLSRVALASDDRSKAVTYLLDASKAPPSDDLAYNPTVTIHRALKSLIDSGERASLIEYFERMAQTSVSDKDRLQKSAEAIRAGKMPDWYQYQSGAE